MGSPFNPIRDQVRSEMLAALAKGAAMTTNELYSVCPSAVDARDVSRLAYELRKKGVIASGEPVLNAIGVRVNSFFLPTTTDPRIEASKPIVVERKIPKTGKSNKPRASNPYAKFTVSKPQEEAPRVTRDLPIHLQSAAPPVAAESVKLLIEEAMSQEPTPYIVNPQFALEPKDVDSDLVSALLELAHQEIEADSADDLLAKMVPLPQADDDDDVLAMASSDVSEIAAAMGKEEPKKVCQCVRINSLPPLPEGYIYGGIKVWIEARHDVGHLAITTHDEGGGPFCSLKATGHLSFDTGDMVAIGKVADALIKLHESMGDGHE